MYIPNNKNLQSDENTSYAGAQELWAIEGALTKYSSNLVRVLSSFFKKEGRILEFGAGIGTLATLWKKHAGNKPECLEIDPTLQVELKKRGFTCYESIDELTGMYDGIYSSNVLEHIENDVAILISLHKKLNPGSCIAVYVPAFMCLYSSMDSAVGHYRRYSKKELCSKLELAGFRVKHASYADSIGFFVWMLLKLRGSKSKDSLSNIQALSKYDNYIFPLSCFLDRLGLSYFLGKNLLVVGQKLESVEIS